MWDSGSGSRTGSMGDCCDNDLMTADISVAKKVEEEEPSQEGRDKNAFGKEQTAQPTRKVPHTHEKRAGYAVIKPEFLLHDYKPTLHAKYLSEQTKKELGEALTKDKTKNGDEALEKRPRAQDEDEDEDNVEEPSTKKAKLKGRNKHRPQNNRIQEKDKLCPSIKAGKDCKFGDSCRYTHDRTDFFEKKLPDLPETCPIFKHFGFCRCGISCRYAKSHLSEDLDNVVNEELYDKMKSSLVCYNVLSDEVKRKLWKRKFNFSKAMKAVKNAQKTLDPSKNQDAEKSSCKNSEGFERNTAVQSPEGVKESLEKKETSESPVLKDNGPSQDKEINDLDPTNAKNEGGGSLESTNMPTTEREAEIDSMANVRTLGDITDEELIRVRPQEKRKIDFKNKLYLAPLTTVGNLPFRRVCKGLGADVTCGEMALASQLLKGKLSEWSLIKRHPSEDLFGVQICGAYPDMMAKCAQVLTETTNLDFIDINCGCPIDLIFKKGAGSALLGKATKLEQISRSMIGVMGDMPLTVKIRTGVYDNKQIAHTLIPRLRDAGVSLVTLHGRSREQRYTKLADWEYISKCAGAGAPMPVFGNGDILSYEDANLHMESCGVSGVMMARGALIKPWIFTEIKEQRHWDISANERFDILKSFTNYGLEHWGSDHQGLENTRRFLLEWLSFLHRYIPVGVLEQVPQRINERPPYYVGRNDLETLMASANCGDWIKLSEMLLGPVPPDFKFLPKHKANAYQ